MKPHWEIGRPKDYRDKIIRRVLLFLKKIRLL